MSAVRRMRYRRRFPTAIRDPHGKCLLVNRCSQRGDRLRGKRFVDRSWGSNGVVPMPGKRAASFDEVAKNMGLSPAQYASSAELKEWARTNRTRRYVPIDLLIAWGFEVESL